MACGENPKRVYASAVPRRAWATSPAIAPQWIKAERYRRNGTSGSPTGKGDPPDARPRARDARRGAARQHPRAQPLLPRRRDGADDRHREGVRLQDPLVPSRRRGVQDRRPARARRHLARRCGPTGAASRWRRSTAYAPTSRSCTRAGARAIIHSDDPDGSQRLNQEAAKAMAAGHAIGLTRHARTTRSSGSRSTRRGRSGSTIGSARSSRARTPTSCSGPANPFSVYARAEKVWIDGALRFDRLDPASRWRTDFELGFVPAGSTR